jgi:hypothetical protein
MPGWRQPTEAPVNLLYTAAAQTVAVQLTRINQTPVGISTFPAGTASPTVLQTIQPSLNAPTATVSPTSNDTSNGDPCDAVKFIEDITVPDNTELNPGASFLKTWRLQNTGSCTWTPAYSIVYEGDNVLNAPATAQLTTQNVPPGGLVDVSLTLTAPTTAGVYRQDFKLSNPSGLRFGLGDANKPFWAQIKVVASTGIAYDFLANASQAEWVSGTGTTLDTPVAFDAADDNPNGVAKIKQNMTLENGASSGKILLTYPKHDPQGIIAGTYPAYRVQNGDKLKARVGFIANPDGSCGTGQVKFQILYLDAGSVYSLVERSKSCNGILSPIEIPLSTLEGKEIHFIFMVKVDNNHEQDAWAIWNSPLIER